MTTELIAKPMNSTERAELRRLIKQEFALLEQEMVLAADGYLVAEESKIREAYAKAQEKLDLYRKAVEAIEKEAEVELSRLAKKTYDPLSHSTTGTKVRIQAYVPHLSLKHQARELTELSQDVSRRKAKANLELARARNDIERDLCLSALTSGEALEIVERIPRAADLLGISEVPAAKAIG